MSSLTSHLFVYGTLRSGFENRYAKLLHESSTFVGLGKTHGRMYRLDGYPGLVLAHESSTEWAFGEVFQLLQPEATFAILDPWEGEDYQRVRVRVELDSGVLQECWVYEYRVEVAGEARIWSGDFLNP